MLARWQHGYNVSDDRERQLRIELMTVQIDLYRRQARWETLRAVAVFITAVVAVSGVILTLAHFIK